MALTIAIGRGIREPNNKDLDAFLSRPIIMPLLGCGLYNSIHCELVPGGG
jgi:hypothetical protein